MSAITIVWSITETGRKYSGRLSNCVEEALNETPALLVAQIDSPLSLDICYVGSRACRRRSKVRTDGWIDHELGNRSNRAKTVFRRTTGALAPRTSWSLETERTKKITQKTYGIVITQ
ncbi:hypothetical protein [Paraburkholderia sp. RL17-347-BIC-D]|uniref:hypothetical protein n=1 Tax=Paraburkholderia sp. RL17-347-BIC-D TaxID=3031632 RepID=UPI0038BD9E75